MEPENLTPEERRKWLEEQFDYESSLVDESSMEILHEMEALDPHLLDEWEGGFDIEDVL